MTTHIVEDGEHLPGIAERYGFQSHKTLWDHPENALLRQRGRLPEILLSGDEIVIPEKNHEPLVASTGQMHPLVVRSARLQLRLRVRDLGAQPIADADCRLSVGLAADEELRTDADGRVSQAIARSTSHALFTLANDTFDVAVGALDPIDTPTGWRGRLVNLGYLESDESDPRELQAAVEEFQCDVRLPLTGKMDDRTRAKLLVEHGC